MTGAVLFGYFSENLGRRRTMISALTLSLVMIPMWAFGISPLTLVVGAFLMQVGVQGAWGIIPAHLNELSPHAVRGLMPGLAYQLGILFAAPTNIIEFALRDKFDMPGALAAFEIVTIVLGAVILALGPEDKGRDFVPG